MTEKAITLLALSTAHRAQTLAYIKISNIKTTTRGLEIRIPDLIKTSGPGRYQPLLILPKFIEEPKLCVASVIAEYIEATKVLRGDADTLFIAIKKPHKPIGSQTIGRWIKNVLTTSGIDTKIFSAHSTRHAATSTALLRGVDLATIRRTAGWSNNSQVFATFYNRPILPDNYKFANMIILRQTN